MQNFLRGVFRDAVYPKDIWHGDATYPRIFCRGVPKIGGVKYPMTPGWGTILNCVAYRVEPGLSETRLRLFLQYPAPMIRQF